MIKTKVTAAFFWWLGAWCLTSNSGDGGGPSVVLLCEAAPQEDRIQHLPDFGPPPTLHYSGYLDATAGCDTKVNGKYCKLHYWLAMAEGDQPLDQPVVLWLNGGPGSSSLFGFLQENGPLLINATGGLLKNPYSWTKLANILALEAPVGVGYSYCAKQKKHGKACQNSDKYTASASRAALQDFFVHKFPELARNDFFITGESYAGIYIPTLTKEILDHASDDMNLVGIAVGDPCTDNTAQQDSMDSLWYGYKNGLVDEQVYDLLWNKCSARFPNVRNDDNDQQGDDGKHHHGASSKWNRQHFQSVLMQSHPLVHEIDQYGLADMALHYHANDKQQHHVVKMLSSHGGPRFEKHSDECKLALRKFLVSSSHALSQGWPDMYVDAFSLFAPVTSQSEDDMARYLMRPEVRKALHVQEAPTVNWPDVDVGLDYTRDYDACNAKVPDGAFSMIDFYQDICPRLQITFIFNGDTDPSVSYEGTRTAVKRIGFPELNGGSYRPWFYNQTAASLPVLTEKAPLFGPALSAQGLGPRLGGEVVNYKHGLSFLTVHGSGHMVPQFRPQAALHMLDKLLQKGKVLLSPLLPSNQTLLEMSGHEFKKTTMQWTESAMSEPYVTNGNQHRHHNHHHHHHVKSKKKPRTTTPAIISTAKKNRNIRGSVEIDIDAIF